MNKVTKYARYALAILILYVVFRTNLFGLREGMCPAQTTDADVEAQCQRHGGTYDPATKQCSCSDGSTPTQD